MRATTAGMTSVAATRVTPMICSVARIDSDSTSMSSASVRATLTPETAATSGSKVREQQRAVADGEDDRGERRARAASSSRSADATPMMLPNSSASKDGPVVPNRVSSATPSANDAVVMTPIAASAPIRRLRATALMASAEASPQSAGAE